VITDPIPSAQAQVTIGAVIIASYVGSHGQLICTFATGDDRFRAVAPGATFLQPPEIGTHLELKGEWDRDPDVGDIFGITSAALSLVQGETIRIWLQYNVLGMGTWYPRELWRTFGAELPSLLVTGQYAALSMTARGHRRFPFDVIVDACTAWVAYEKEMAVASQFVDLHVQKDTLRAIPFYGDRAAELLQLNPYRLSAFTDFSRVDPTILCETGIDHDDPRRLLAGVDSVISTHYGAGLHCIPLQRLKSDLEGLLGSASHLTTKAITLAMQEERIWPLDDEFVQGAAIRLLEKSLVSALCDRNWDAVDVFMLETASALQDVVAKNASRTEALSVVFTSAHASSSINVDSNEDSCLGYVYWIPTHTSYLRTTSPHSKQRILPLDELISGRHFWPETLSAIVLLETHMYSLTTWLKVLRGLPRDTHLFICGSQHQDHRPDSPWSAIVRSLEEKAEQEPLFQEKEVSRFPAVTRAIAEICNIINPSYQTGSNEDCLSADVPLNRCVDAALGISYQLQQRNWSVQMLCPERDLRHELNNGMQHAQQQIRPSAGVQVGTKKFFKGDSVVQTVLWADGLRPNSFAQILTVYAQPEVVRRSDGRLARLHVEVSQDKNCVQLPMDQVASLELAFALPANCENLEGVDAVLIVTSSFANLDVSYLQLAIQIAAAQIVFIGPGSSFFKPCTAPKYDVTPMRTLTTDLRRRRNR
jgi:hypothetical protein